MNSGRKQRISDAFGAAADHYDDHAGPQRMAAALVADLAQRQRPGAVERIRRALPRRSDGDDTGVAATVFDLIDAAGGPLSLAELGMRRAHVAGMVEQILDAVPGDNPSPVFADDVFSILDAAFEGRRPSDAPRG